MMFLGTSLFANNENTFLCLAEFELGHIISDGIEMDRKKVAVILT